MWHECVFVRRLQRLFLVSFRFGVVQGVKANGAPKVRAVDNMSWAHCAEEEARRESQRTVLLVFALCLKE